MKKASVVVLAGQSNAVGVGFVKCLPYHFSEEKIDKLQNGHKNVMINYNSHDKESGGFCPVTFGCAEVAKYTLGPEVGIAENLSLRYPEHEIFIVKCAFGGADLHSEWISPSARNENTKTPNCGKPVGWCYDALIKIMNESLEYLEGQGYTPEIKGFCWMQGESDADTIERVTEYESLYNTMLSDFNTAYEKYLKNCIYVDAGISDIWNCYKEMNSFKLNYSKKADNRRYFDTLAHGLTTRNEPREDPDIYHYDSDSILKLGELFGAHIDL